jgi:hypothetical protein
MVVPLVSTAVLSVIFGLFPNAFVHVLDLATVIMEQIFDAGGAL